jgi:hypothetical protein
VTKKATRRASKEAPLGLALAFKWLLEDDLKSSAAKTYADKIYPHALALIEAVQHDDSYAGVDDVLEEATKAKYSGCLDDDGEIAHVFHGRAGLYVGFAACWLMMQNVHGGAR